MKTIEELKILSDSERISYLKKQWGMPNDGGIKVKGILNLIEDESKNIQFLLLGKVQNLFKESLEYPVKNLATGEKIHNRGIYVPLSTTNHLSEELKAILKKGKSFYILCELVLAIEEERNKHNNPLLLQVLPLSVRPLKHIGSAEIMANKDGILIEDSIFNTLVSQNQSEINEKKQEAEEEVKAHRKKMEEELDSDILILNDMIDEHKKEVELLDKIKQDNEILIQEKEDEYEELKNEISETKKEAKSLGIIKINLVAAIKKEEESHMKKLEKFNSFVKSKADTLRDLEFIGEEEYNDLIITPKAIIDFENTVHFHKDLRNDFPSAISHIQAYLYNQDILYPRYILEDYFALIQTNDLIILAGESGSGKTNLVKSFAKAVGGVSKIIPVKPNWTSSEDLLGYYNPLEKKYLSTPFLETLIEASKNPGIPYFICLDEMNLARVEYYFADFLSLLEERESTPEIELYSDDESSHVLSEFNNVLKLIDSAKDKYKKGNIVNFIELLQDIEINEELKRVFGFSDKDSLIKYHSDLRRMISGIVNIPSSIKFPQNVRIIGAINIDETTHYLSPKILDRAHIMKFDSPLLFDWEQIEQEINNEFEVEKTIHFEIEDFGWRNKYPKFDLQNDFCRAIARLTKEYFSPLGMEVGLRTIRQGLNYQNKIQQFSDTDSLFLNNFFIHKILPKMNFDGSKMVGETEKKNFLLRLQNELTHDVIEEKVLPKDGIDANKELDDLIKKAEANDWIVNYWA